MIAPDKIYLHGYEFSIRPVKSWSEKMTDGLKGHNAINVEYIRKDALLDWLKAVKADVMIPMNIDRVIEKIESL